MSILPSIRACLTERFLFNVRMPLESLARFLPVAWLAPQPVNGHGVVSFCVLNLRNITVAPLPSVAGLRSISCAPRYAVLDRSQGGLSPAVFVTERLTSSAFGAWFTSLGFSAPHPHAQFEIHKDQPGASIRVSTAKAGSLFAASVRPTGEQSSRLFASPQVFAAFIAEGITSYGLSRHQGRLTKLDLHKEDGTYEPLEVEAISGPLVETWKAAGGVLDSAYRTSGGLYEWTYHGLVDDSTGQAA